MNELLTRGVGPGKLLKHKKLEFKLIDCFCKVITGGTPSTSNSSYWKSGSFPWMSSGEVHKKRIKTVDGAITEEGLKNSSAKMLPKKSVVIALAGQGRTRGTVALTEIETTTNQSIAGIVPDQSICDAEFLYFNLDSRYLELRSISGGSGRAGLNLQILKSIEVMLPPLPEQKKIAAILTSIDNQVSAAREKLSQTQSLKKSLMQDLLTGRVRVNT